MSASNQSIRKGFGNEKARSQAVTLTSLCFKSCQVFGNIELATMTEKEKQCFDKCVASVLAISPAP